MSGPMSSVLSGCPQSLVTCTSAWLCDAELSSVLNVSFSENTKKEEKDITRECCVHLEPAPNLEIGSPCSLILYCVAQGKDRILSLNICSQAKTIEVYSLSPDGQEEEYLGTSRGEHLCTFPSNNEEASSVTLYSTYLKLDFPVPSCKVKLLSLGGKQRLFLSEISVQVTSVPEKCSQASAALGPSINLDRVQSMMDSMGGKMSPGAEQLMSMVRAQQKHQMPFGNHLLQFFSNFGSGIDRVQKHEEGESQIPSANHLLGQKHDLHKQNQDFHPSVEPSTTLQCTGPPNSNSKTILPSFLQAQKGCIAGGFSPDSLLPFLQNLSVENKQSSTQQGATKPMCQETRETEIGAVLERLLSVQMERMERALMKHIDQKMKILEDHLDVRLDHLINVIQTSTTTSSGTTMETKMNGDSDHSGNGKNDCIVLSKHYLSNMSAHS
ncbi:Hypothetical predicted protein [Pelobates cultripes]|uniref:Uncharacterized protein n=1 Tax=Pelobates cultripes TaxID=61616 RepID=A0AAD1TG83_PELCU|nr:Hypothetical predicted protein [Pelobates cultripes]